MGEGVAKSGAASQGAKASQADARVTQSSAGQSSSAPEARSAQPSAAATAKAPQQGAAPAAALDLGSLEQRLKDTRGIGLFTKLSLKNQVDDLLGQLRAFHGGKLPPTLSDLRQRYDLLLMKVLSLLQDGDPPLASAIASSREALWGMLADPQKFSKL